MTSTNLNPLIQWVGGKRRLIPELLRYMPENFNTYYEPFVGGVPFGLLSSRTGQLLMILMPN